MKHVDSDMSIKWLDKLLKVVFIPKGNDTENGQHDAHIQPHPSSQSLFTHSQHFHNQLELTKEQIHEKPHEN